MKHEDVARTAHNVNGVLNEALALGPVGKRWEEASDEHKAITMDGVEFLLAKPDSTPEDCHNHWVEKMKEAGWKHGEEKNEEEKTHPCIVPFEELGPKQQTKHKVFVAVVQSMWGN